MKNINSKFSSIKCCTDCGILLTINKNWNLNRKKGNRYICRECENNRGKDYYKRNKKKILKKLQENRVWKKKYCIICKKDISYKKSNTKYCNSCKRTKNQITHELKINGCAICGYNKCDAGLEFHHVNSGDKTFNISLWDKYTNEEICNELNKCILFCANCHAEIHSIKK